MRTHRSRRHVVGRLALAVAVLCCTALTPAAPAAAAGREFHGQVVRVSDKSLVVENRMGDRRRFSRTEATRVEGRPGWQALAPGDRVIVDYVRQGQRHEIRRVIVLGGGD